ncbi:hypothetical protein N0B31_07730 [Salinirubellus salinus]|uniref:Uncharacterized protein n=1 Tax=Salinirubellus salinus TaxID=1364945 RepID=A0A9E7R5V5_9EURY|nr:hypothetical protein [Salinirubellus salinus]UWM56172.1 hypothetical protein N0B31_07730 [Salinirubellus salinus]
MRSALPVAVLLLCAVLAGCSFADTGGPPTPAETLTPVPIDESTPTAAPDRPTRQPRTATRTPAARPFDLPNGYGVSGVTDVRVAAQGHRLSLDNRSNYRLDAEAVVIEADGPRRTTSTRRLVSQDATLVQIRENGSLTLAVYETDEAIYALRLDPSDARFRLQSQYVTIAGPTVDRQFSDVVTALRYRRGAATSIVSNADWGAMGVVETENETVLEYRATRPARPLSGDAGMTQYEARLLVDESGLVRFAGVRGVAESEDGWGQRRYTTRVSDIGTTTVEPPAWLGGVAEANATIEDGYVVVENTGDRAIPLSTVEVDRVDSG